MEDSLYFSEGFIFETCDVPVSFHRTRERGTPRKRGGVPREGGGAMQWQKG